MTTTLPATSLTQHLMRRTLGDAPIALPFARDIFLLETHVAGIRYYAAAQAGAGLSVGAPLHLRREPGNPHDELAIGIFTASGEKLGYVPRHRNPVLARLMDAGKTLLAEVAHISRLPEGEPWYMHSDESLEISDIRLRISLREF
jgi:hypothetical protein